MDAARYRQVREIFLDAYDCMPNCFPLNVGEKCFAAVARSQFLDIVGTKVMKKRGPVLATQFKNRAG